MSAPRPQLPQCHAVVTARIAAERGGILGLEGQTTRPRFRLLSDACFKGDIQYILLHQSYCMWSLNPESAVRVFSCGAEELDAAFRALQGLLKPNDGMTLEHMRWFSSFPSSSLIESFNATALKNAKADIVRFLRAFPTHWPLLAGLCQSRQFPIMAWEVMENLSCRSVMLQDLIFTLSRRMLDCEDGPLAEELSALFCAGRNNERAAVAQRHTPEAVSRSRSEMAARYMAVMERVRVHAQQKRNAQPQNLHSSPTVHQSPSFHQDAHFQQLPPQGLSGAQNARGVVQGVSRSPTVPSSSQGNWQNFSHPTQNSITAGAANVTGRQTPTSQHGGASQAVQNPSHTVSMAMNSHANIPSNTQSSTASTPQSSAPKPSQGSPFTSAAPAERQPRPQSTSRYLPPNGPYDLSSLRVGLHLADNRSPMRVPIQPSRSRYYQFIRAFKVPPTKLVPGLGIRDVQITVSSEDADHLQRTACTPLAGSSPVVHYFNRSRRYRLRLCKFEEDHAEIDDSLWAITPSFWPQNIHVALNGRPFLLKRKRQFRFDIPLELTHTLTGRDNTLKISFPNLTDSEKKYFFFYAVEEVMTLDDETTRRMVNDAPHSTLEQTLLEIRRRLTPRDSQELMFQQGSLNIRIADPLSSLLPEKPVRGASCKHWECFDLDTWLLSRQGKKFGSDHEPSLADDWNCPICGLDARPCHLRVCDYFVEVTRQLQQVNMAHIKAIQIEADGVWQALEENRTQPGPDDGQRRSASVKASPEVIEILDD